MEYLELGFDAGVFSASGLTSEEGDEMENVEKATERHSLILSSESSAHVSRACVAK